MTTTFSVTRDDIIKAALKECGAVGTGEFTTGSFSEDISDAAFALNIIIKSWVKKGMPLWKIVEVQVPMITSNITYQIGPTATGTGAVVTDRPLRVFDPFLRDSAGKDITLQPLARSDYEMLGFKTSLSIPNSIYYQSLSVNGLLTVYPAPSDSTRTIHLFAQIPISDVNSGTDVLDFPSECFQALKWNLCAEIAGPYVSSDTKIKRIEQKAAIFKDEMEAWGTEEASLYFSLDKRDFN